jgi:multiple sugar transport system substrate-binding protein
MTKKSRPNFVSRRNFLKGMVAATAAAAWTPALRALAAEQAQRNRARLAKQGDNVLRIIALNWPQTPVEQQLADEVFTPETGIEVVLQGTDYTFTEQRVRQLVASGSTEFDIYHYDSQWLGGFVAAGALEQLDTDAYLNSGSSSIAWEDFFAPITERLGRYNGQVYGLPWSLNAQILWYRKDLMETPPATWEEVREMARDLTTDDMYGWAWEGSRAGDFISVDYCPVLWSNGGALWDEENWVAEGYINSDVAIESIEFMRAMVDPEQDGSVDPASGNWTINERLAALLNGQTAMALNWAPLFGNVAETDDSPVKGKIGYTLSPAGSEAQYHMFGCQGTGINALSTKKEQAWQYLQWLLSRETQEALTTTPSAGFFSARIDLQETAAAQSEWHAAFSQSIPNIRDFWNNANYAELLDTTQRALNLIYIGRADAAETLNDLAVQHQVIYDTSPENPANM